MAKCTGVGSPESVKGRKEGRKNERKKVLGGYKTETAAAK
jgi:hypothetical protein